ncbi:MAG: IS982 family transposase [Thermomicrobiales bacterium]
MLSTWHAHRDLFPHQPERSRFNRRRRQLAGAINQGRRLLLAPLDLAHDRQCVLDRLPVPVIRFHLVPGSHARATWAAYGARFGWVPSKKQTIFGYKLYLLATLNGVILDVVLAPADVAEVTVGVELLEAHTDLEVLGDKAFISAPVAADLRAANRIRLLTLPRRNALRQVPRAVRRTLNRARQIIETVNSQLAEQFHLEVNHAQSFHGLCARLFTKLTAHTLCLCINRLLEQPDILHIKALAFPHPN